MILRMTDDFTCPLCGGNMFDIEGHYICRYCEWIDGEPSNVPLIPEKAAHK